MNNVNINPRAEHCLQWSAVADLTRVGFLAGCPEPAA